ncbi:hypothetical protein XELAEV_18000204mg [Xenopus laevis]|uniref:Uncharacterized protein n=1 Tax=Xenopus laevis TaxID=8355 RepID=A0A974GZH8_XENLA|nr:hypothetical protein XELAEV_18000204mg [Xenopus laevis]
MFKGKFLCVFFAVLIANSMAKPGGFADEDGINKRGVRRFPTFTDTNRLIDLVEELPARVGGDSTVDHYGMQIT